MREIKFPSVAVVSAICSALSFTPLPGHGADLVIGNNVATSGNWSLNGAITANSFIGSGSGLTGVTASNLNCTGCVSPSELSFIPGTITGVNAMTGLIGGGNSGNVSLAVDFDGSGGAGTAARSDHHHDHLYMWKYGKVAIVAQSGGDYPNPYAAMVDSGSWCGTASETNPCLVKIMPGVYDVGGNSVQMKNYIDIEGSGENTTKIKGNISAFNSGVVRGAIFAEIRFLSVENIGGGAENAIAMYNNQASPKITNVTLTARNSSWSSIALFNENLSLPVLTNVTLEAFDAVVGSIGVFSSNLCNPQLTNVKIRASGAPQNLGVNSKQYVVTIINNGNIEVSGGGNGSLNVGVYPDDNSTANVYNSSITANGPGNSYAIILLNYSTLNIFSSSLAANGTSLTRAIHIENNSTLSLNNSSILATGTSTSWAIGVINFTSSTVKFENTSVEAKSGSLNIGVQNASTGGKVTINHSSITGAQTSIRNDTNTPNFWVGASKIDGPVEGVTLCTYSYSGIYGELGIDCR
jgi:hypothetical protein